MKVEIKIDSSYTDSKYFIPTASMSDNVKSVVKNLLKMSLKSFPVVRMEKLKSWNSQIYLFWNFCIDFCVYMDNAVYAWKA